MKMPNSAKKATNSGTSTPATLRPFIFHGLDLQWRDGDREAVCECPFCGKANKFSINIEKGVWRCFTCETGSEKGGGNISTFLKLLWQRSDEATNGESDILAKDRRLLYPDTVAQWGVCQSIITKSWLVPAYNKDNTLCQLYVWLPDMKTGKMRLLPTPELGHHIHGMYNSKRPEIYLCEGPWDAMALWELLKSAKRGESGLTSTGNEVISLLNKVSVMAVPGCLNFNESWLPMFAGKSVVLLYDSDHPRTHAGKEIKPPGLAGMQKVAAVLASSAEYAPKDISYLCWGDAGYDPALPSGYDVRDMLTEKNGVPERLSSLWKMLGKIKPIPEDWIAGRSKDAVKNGSTQITSKKCESWNVLNNSWRKAMKWTEGLDRSLSVMLACITSTKAVGDQLWCKIVGPASCGKSTLCEALSVNRDYVYPKSTLRGFHSGYDDGSGENHSPLEKMKDKTLVIKDGDALLQAPNLSQILSEARDIYDRVSRSSYRTRQSKDWEGLNITIILCGTGSIRALDSSELGERFLDCVIMEAIDDDLEDEILTRQGFKSFRNVKRVSNAKSETQHDPDLLKAMQLTGGYITYLRDNAEDLLGELKCSDDMMRNFIDLGKFVAYARARPSKKQEEVAERELGARLVSQMVRLGSCLAVVLNKNEIDREVMRRVRMVALDTARGTTLEIIKNLYASGEKGMDAKTLSIYGNMTEDKNYGLLRFLKRIGVVEYFTPSIAPSVKGRPRWRLSQKLSKLYREVTDATA